MAQLTANTITDGATEPVSVTIKHIRRAGKMRHDKRFRSALARTNVNRYGTICGAEPTNLDIDKAGAAHLRQCARVPQLAHWIADVCPACLAALPEGE